MGEQKNAYKKAVNEAIGTKKKYRRKKGLRISNEEIKNAIGNKQTNKQLTKNTYKTLMKKILKHTHTQKKGT